MGLLPPGYEMLESYVPAWALPSSAQRANRRGDSTIEERQAFYDAVQPLAGKALAELDAKKLADLNESEKRLLDLVMAFGHVALAIEIQGSAEADHTIWRNRMAVTAAPADLPA